MNKQNKDFIKKCQNCQKAAKPTFPLGQQQPDRARGYIRKWKTNTIPNMAHVKEHNTLNFKGNKEDWVPDEIIEKIGSVFQNTLIYVCNEKKLVRTHTD